MNEIGPNAERNMTLLRDEKRTNELTSLSIVHHPHPTPSNTMSCPTKDTHERGKPRRKRTLATLNRDRSQRIVQSVTQVQKEKGIDRETD
jgi:hypothetical protein